MTVKELIDQLSKYLGSGMEDAVVYLDTENLRDENFDIGYLTQLEIEDVGVIDEG